MFARTFGIAIVGLSLFAFGLQAGGGQKDGKDKKFEIPKDAIAGTVKSVDLKLAKFTITLTDGKSRSFGVDDKTEFWGPKGGDRGTGPKGLKDDCMAVGYEIKVTATKDGKTATNVYLPNRKAEEKKDKK
jgi:hypothetical protein